MANVKVGKKYFCEKCDYYARDKSNFNKHLSTDKHKFITDANFMLTKSSELDFSCECGKFYLHKSSLCRHKKNCKVGKLVEKVGNDINTFNMQDVVNLIKVVTTEQCEQQKIMLEQLSNKHFQEHQKMLTEIIPKIGNTTNNNNQFNINMFLNEKCKDAINIKEFIDMIVFNKDTMDDSKNLGIEKTMTNLIINKLNSLDIHKRPIHCSDLRRESIYVKDNGEWTKTNTKTILKKMIRSIQDKGCATLSEWRKQNPDDPKGNPDLLDPNALYYHKVIKQVCLETEKYDDKVIRNICKTTYVK